MAALCAAGMITLAGCGGGSGGSTGVSVVTGVYPLEWLATQIGGEHVDVMNLTEPGAEPHDLELTPRQIGRVSSSDIAFHISGLQPAVDEAIEQEGGENALDVADLVELRPANDTGEHTEDGEHGHEEDHDHGAADPHMWLDTARMEKIATALADRLGQVDPDHADDYRTNADQVVSELAEIGALYTEGLAECESRDMVVSHSAFGYLADEFELNQISVSGIDPDTEPSPARMAEVADLVEEHEVTTIFTETLTSPKVAETIAEETGAATAVLDPLEGITDQSPGDDYPTVMRGNLEALQTALRCS